MCVPRACAATSAWYSLACDFLTSIGEPISRPEFIHEYRLDKNSLITAASTGLTPDIILSVLDKLSKTPIAPSVVKAVQDATSGYSKVKLIMQR